MTRRVPAFVLITAVAAIVWLGFFASKTVRRSSPVSPTPADLSVDWPKFLSRCDPVWSWGDSRDPPHSWLEAPFAGNGNLGIMAWVDDSRLRIEISRTDVYDDRSPGSSPNVTGNFVFDRPRLPVGRFFVSIPGEGVALKGNVRIDLWNGEISGSVGQSGVGLQAFVHATADVIAVKISVPPSIRSPPLIAFSEADAQSSIGMNPEWRKGRAYARNPPQTCTRSPTSGACTQRLLSGSSFSTVWEVLPQAMKSSGWKDFILFATISPVISESSDVVAKKRVGEAVDLGWKAFSQSHREWWNSFYSASFLTLNSTKLESFYWIQMYKLASGTREDKSVFDLQGPWMVEGTHWPDLHWDLNIQLTYWPVYASNRLNLGLSLVKYLLSHERAFAANVPTDFCTDCGAAPSTGSALDALESCYWLHRDDCKVSTPTICGNLMWACHNAWLSYRHSMDRGILHDIFPILRRAVQFYGSLHEVGREDNLIHLPTTFSPEFPYRGPDSHYDLALYRWGLGTIIQAAEILGIADPSLEKWKDTLSRLAPFPTGGNGFTIAAGVPVNVSHRHFSHLFAVYPLSELTDWNDPKQVRLAEVSVDHWASLPELMQGYSLSALSTMSVLLGRREAAIGNLSKLLDVYIHKNTFYSEEIGETRNPCGETPLAAASSLQDIFMMSDDTGTIRVFPGVPSGSKTLADAAFWNLRARGSVLVSAKLGKDGRHADFVTLTNAHGGSTRVKLFHGIETPVLASSTASPAVISFDDPSISLDIDPGATVNLWSSKFGPRPPPFIISPASGTLKEANFWGKR